jgi:hypothetical protein
MQSMAIYTAGPAAAEFSATVPFNIFATSVPFYSYEPTSATAATSIFGDPEAPEFQLNITGTGLTFDENGVLTGGTVTGVTWLYQGALLSSVTGITASLSDLDAGAAALFGGNDTITTLDGDDFIEAFGGDDVIVSGKGNDVIDGGTGYDVLQMNTTFDGWTLGKNEDGDTTLTGPGEDNEKTLLRIEEARFLDGAMKFDGSGDAGKVEKLYLAALGRGGDAMGIGHHAEQLADGEQTMVSLAQGMLDSAEFKARFGTLDDTAFVTGLYQKVLGRDPSAAELSTLVTQLQNGSTRAQALVGFAESEEFAVRTQEHFAKGVWGADANVVDAVRVYEAVLNRKGSAAEIAHHAALLDQGMDIGDMIATFVASAEFQQGFGGLDNRAFVEAMYTNIFDRAGDAGGVAAWVDALNNGLSRADLVEAFALSEEMTQKLTLDVQDGLVFA